MSVLSEIAGGRGRAMWGLSISFPGSTQRDRPIEVQSTVMMDGDAVAWSIGSALDGGGGGAARMRSAIAGRSNG